MTWVALYLYVAGAVLVWALLSEDDGSRLKISVLGWAVILSWPVSAPLIFTWVFTVWFILDREDD